MLKSRIVETNITMNNQQRKTPVFALNRKQEPHLKSAEEDIISILLRFPLFR